MADVANEVVEEVRTDAAIDAANRVAEVAAVGDQIVMEQVSRVEETLENHQEQSEERHVEILEGQEWLENQFQLLSSNQQAMNTQLSSIAAAQVAQTASLTTLLETVLQRLTVSPQSTQEPPPSTQEPPPNQEPVNPANEEGVAQPEAPPPPKKRNRVI